MAEAPKNFYGGDERNEDHLSQVESYLIELKNDGSKQLFISNSSGGSGGTGWSIYAKKKKNWVLIGLCQGRVTICASSDGYKQIEVRGRGGPRSFTKELYRFQGTRYHLVRLENWKIADDRGTEKLIGVQDPNVYDDASAFEK